MADQVRTETIARAGQPTAATVNLRKQPRIGESIIQSFLFICAVVSIFTTIGIIVVLGTEAWLFFGDPDVSLVEFVTTTVWQPALEEFGILPLLNATLMTSFIAMCVAIPLGLAAAIYLAEYASGRLRSLLKPALELLAGVPTVVYGYFALTFVTPMLRNIFGEGTVQIYNTLAAGLVVGILITPVIATLAEDALSSVPSGLRQASYGLGATKFETAIHVVFPSALSGVLAAGIIGLSRAVGETMIVALAAGASPNFTFNPFQPAETMTGHIARISGGDLSYGTIDYKAIFAVGLVLFLVTLLLNIISRIIVTRFREVYE